MLTEADYELLSSIHQTGTRKVSLAFYVYFLVFSVHISTHTLATILGALGSVN